MFESVSGLADNELISKFESVQFQHRMLLELQETLKPYVDAFPSLYKEAEEACCSVKYGQGCNLDFGFYDPFVMVELFFKKNPHGRLFNQEPRRGVYELYRYDQEGKVRSSIRNASTRDAYWDGGTLYAYESDVNIFIGYMRDKGDNFKPFVSKIGILMCSETRDFALECSVGREPEKNMLTSLLLFRQGQFKGKVFQCEYMKETGAMEDVFEVEFDQKNQIKNATPISKKLWISQKYGLKK